MSYIPIQTPFKSSRLAARQALQRREQLIVVLCIVMGILVIAGAGMVHRMPGGLY